MGVAPRQWRLRSLRNWFCVPALLVLGLAVPAGADDAVVYQFVRSWGVRGSSEGKFSSPQGIAVDNDGHVYVADTGNHRIQKFKTDGTFIARWGVYGSNSNEFIGPAAVAVSAGGAVYVADTNNGRIQKFTSDGEFVKLWRLPVGSDGYIGLAAGIAVDPNGFVLVTDWTHHLIYKYTTDGEFVATWGVEDSLNRPWGIAVAPDRYVYVVNQGSSLVFKLTAGGAFSKQFGSGQSRQPTGVATDGDAVFVADTQGNRIVKFRTDGTFVTRWGAEGDGNGKFSTPVGVAVDENGLVYVADTGNHRVQVFRPVTGVTLAGKLTLAGLDASGAAVTLTTEAGQQFTTRTDTEGNFSVDGIQLADLSSAKITKKFSKSDSGKIYANGLTGAIQLGGGAVAGAKVTLSNSKLPAVKTNASGEFTFGKPLKQKVYTLLIKKAY